MGTSSKDDIAFVEALGALLVREDLAELEVERSAPDAPALKVRLVRHRPAPAVAALAPAPAPAPLPQPAAAPAPSAPAPAEPSPGEEGLDIPNAVRSPMVGTAYLAPEPGRPAFVAVGDSVKEGQTLMIIEAMKTMNQIPAPRDGTVRRILIDDAAPVEFDTPLMVLD